MPKSIFVEVTDEQHATFWQLASERGLTMRDLIVSMVLGIQPDGLLGRVCDLEARVRLLESNK